MARIYVASSWRNVYYPEVVTRLREAGHEVYDFRNPRMVMVVSNGRTLILIMISGLLKNISRASSIHHLSVSSKQILMHLTGQIHAW